MTFPLPFIVPSKKIALNFPEWVASRTTTMSTSSTNLSVGLPLVTKLPGDLIVIVTNARAEVTFPSTWTKIYQSIGGGGLAIAYLIWDGGNSKNAQVNGGGSYKRAAISFIIRNTTGRVAVGEGIDDRTPPAMNASWGLNRNLFIACAGSGQHGGNNFTGAPGGFSNLISRTSTSGTNNSAVGVARAESFTSGYSASSGFTGSSGTISTVMLAIEPLA